MVETGGVEHHSILSPHIMAVREARILLGYVHRLWSVCVTTLHRGYGQNCGHVVACGQSVWLLIESEQLPRSFTERPSFGVACFDAAHAAGDRDAEWQSVRDLGFLWLARDYARAGEFFRPALDLASQLNNSKRLTHSLNRLGNWYANLDQPLQAHGLHRRALAAFKEPGAVLTASALLRGSCVVHAWMLRLGCSPRSGHTRATSTTKRRDEHDEIAKIEEETNP